MVAWCRRRRYADTAVIVAGPVNIVAPVMTNHGYYLSVTHGTWTDGVIAYSYLWYIDNVASPEITEDSWPIPLEFTGPVKCSVTASAPGGEASAFSNTVVIG